ncbi:hypothetical protein [Streptomyces sp. RPT161]|nr:hypothetical protein [Streptomyces sp. RPT161]
MRTDTGAGGVGAEGGGGQHWFQCSGAQVGDEGDRGAARDRAGQVGDWQG